MIFPEYIYASRAIRYSEGIMNCKEGDRIMNKTFYHFLMKYRQPEAKDELTQFANDAYDDHSFPKDSVNYHEISNYLELNGQYLSSLTLFDYAWELYTESERK